MIELAEYCALQGAEVNRIPIRGRANMNINEALIAAQWLGAETVVPIHFDLYTEGSVDPFEFKRKFEETTSKLCIVMNP